jgi:tetratricopeptide (TPR) repeat protein
MVAAPSEKRRVVPISSGLVLLLLILFCSPVFSQTVLVDKAAGHLKKNELGEAQTAIDGAIQNAATSTDPRTWYLKGFIYKELYKANPATSGNLRDVSIESLSKCTQLDVKNTYTKNVTQILDYLYNSYYNDAVDYLNKKEYSVALAGFQKFIDYHSKGKADEFYAEALYNAGFAALSMGQKAKAREFYEKAVQLAHTNPLLYDDLAMLYQDLGESQKAVQTVEAGRKRFPDDENLRITEINLFLAQKQFAKSEKLLEDFLKIDPANTDVMLVAGTVYEAIAQSDSTKRDSYFQKRKEMYSRILAKEPDNYMANYNMAITLYNRAVDLIDPQKNYDLDIINFHNKLELITALFQEALPFAERAAKLSPSSKNTLKALAGIYYYLNDKEKSKQLMNKIDNLDGGKN